MSTEMVSEQSAGAAVPAGPDLSVLADQLVAAARGQGIELTGPGGLLTGLTRQVLETALEVEMADHLGYDRHDRAGHGSGNSRNGSTAKTVRTDVGEVRIAVPRDRAGTFTPAVVPKHARRLAGFDEAVLSLYAKGMTTGDIVNHLSDIYATEVSRELVSKVTDAVIEQMVSWQNRPLDPIYPVILIDAIVLKIRDGQVVLSVVDLADDGVICVADDRGVRRPRPRGADGALVGSVVGCSGGVTDGAGQSAPVSEMAMRAAFSSTMELLRANAAVRALTARLLIARG
jgi:hypothetical protein